MDADEVKTFITLPYFEIPSRTGTGIERHERRFIIFGTSNRRDFLRDPSGHRRYLPFDVPAIDLERVRADKSQLWAEALHIVLERGVTGQSLVDYEDAEHLAVAEHRRFIDQALWVDDEDLLNWLNSGKDRFRTEDALKAVNVWNPRAPERSEMAKSLRQLGYDFRSTHIQGLPGKPKRWRRPRSTSQLEMA